MWNELVREVGAKRDGRVGTRKYKDKKGMDMPSGGSEGKRKWAFYLAEALELCILDGEGM